MDIKDIGEESLNEIKKLLQIDSSCFILFLNRNKNDIDLLISLFGECSTTFIINVSKGGNNYVFDELSYYISINKVID